MKLNFHNVISIIQQYNFVSYFVSEMKLLFTPHCWFNKNSMAIKNCERQRGGTSFSMCLLFYFRKWWRLSYHYWWNTWVSGVLCPLLIIYFLRTLQSLFLSISRSLSRTHIHTFILMPSFILIFWGWFSFNWFYANNLIQLIALCRVNDVFELDDFFENVKKFWKAF